MKKLTLTLMVMLCASCATVIENYQLAPLVAACEKHGGDRRVIANGEYSFVICQNGVKIRYQSVIEIR